MTALKEKILILFVIWLKGLIAILEVGFLTGVLAWLQGGGKDTIRIAVIAAVVPGLIQYLKQSPAPKIPKELIDKVREDLANDTQQFVKGEQDQKPPTV